MQIELCIEIEQKLILAQEINNLNEEIIKLEIDSEKFKRFKSAKTKSLHHQLTKTLKFIRICLNFSSRSKQCRNNYGLRLRIWM